MSLTIFEATQKVSKMAEQKYGCSIDFIYFDLQKNTPLLEHNQEVFDVIEKNFGSQFIISKGRVLVPVYVDSELFGTILVQNGMDLDPSLFEDLHNFLDTTLKDFIIKKEKLRRIKIEESLLSASQNNVIPLFKNHNTLGVRDFSKTDEIDSSYKKNALFLSGGDYSQARTIALEIHSLLNRTSFVPYSALEFQSQNFSNYLSDLGRITIFIPEIIDLSENESQEILNYIQKHSSKNTPFLILSSQKNLNDLEKEDFILSDLLDCLKEFHLEFNTTSQLKSFYSLILPDPDLSPQ